MAAGDLIGPTSAALVFMLAVVGVALIGGLGIRAGCSRTLTFDQKASLLPGFELL